MPPKKKAADSADPPVPSSSDAPVEKQVESKSDVATLRKLAAHPSTAIMVKEALKALDSRKGVSSQAIQNYIKQKYPSVDLVRLKHLVRRTLKKGIETGTLVRPANSNVTTGAMGKFRLARQDKQPKSKTENMDPNVQKVPKAAKDEAKDGAKKTKKTGATKKKKDTENDEPKSLEDSKPPKTSKTDEKATTSKAAPAKKPKAKKAAENGDDDGASDSAKTKAKTAKEAKAGKASQSKAAKAGSDAPASKATGKRGKKTAE
ncbi:protein B4 [Thunnus albacares]|uniref:protein B4 n=1 Tax=Thunnus albacares TaxID=8236 RepID=UPI001CF60D83|nr:protein B4 [Thunnus albacares]